MWKVRKQDDSLHQIVHLFDRHHSSIRGGPGAGRRHIPPPTTRRSSVALALAERDVSSYSQVQLNAVARKLNEHITEKQGFLVLETRRDCELIQSVLRPQICNKYIKHLANKEMGAMSHF